MKAECNIHNDIYRNIFINRINLIMNKANITLVEAIELYIDGIYNNLFNANNKSESEKKDIKLEDQINLVLFLDALKLNIYEQKSLISNIETYSFYASLVSVFENVYNDLSMDVAELIRDRQIYKYILIKGYNFGNLSQISKTNIFNSLTSEENILLSTNNIAHAIDLIEYDSSKIDINYIKNYVKEKRDNLCYTYGIIDDQIIINEIAGYVSNLFKLNIFAGSKLLTEFAKIEYSKCRYIVENGINDAYITNIIKFYENTPFDEIIVQLNTLRLYQLINNFINMSIIKKYKGVNLDDEFTHTSDLASEKVYKKLNI